MKKIFIFILILLHFSISSQNIDRTGCDTKYETGFPIWKYEYQIKEGTTLRKTADDYGESIVSIPALTIVFTTEQTYHNYNEKWMYICYNGNLGYVERRSLKDISQDLRSKWAHEESLKNEASKKNLDDFFLKRDLENLKNSQSSKRKSNAKSTNYNSEFIDLPKSNYNTETISTTEISKSCGSCGKEVENYYKAGMRCPHCKVRWDDERTTKRKSYKYRKKRRRR